ASKLLGRGDRRRADSSPPARTALSAAPRPPRGEGDHRVALARPDRLAAARPPVAVPPLTPAACRLLDRRGDLGRHLARALDVDSTSASRGRIAAALLHAARRLGAPLRRQRGGDA